MQAARRCLIDGYLHRRRGLSTNETDSIRPRQSAAEVPLSLAQEQVWRRAKAVTHPQLYNEAITIHRSGPFDIAAAREALLEIAGRHEIWRTTFAIRNGQPRQRVHAAPAAFDLPSFSLSSRSTDDSERQAAVEASREAARPFDLEHGPLVRALLIHLPDSKHRLILVMHQAVVDGVSAYDIVPREFTALYEAFSAGKPSPLPPLELHYGDFAAWQRRHVTSAVLDRQIDYWRAYLNGAPTTLAWPLDFPRPECESHRGAILPFEFDSESFQQASSICRKCGGTIFSVLAACFAAVLHRYTNQPDLLIGTLSPAGRKRPEVNGLIGYFLNPVALRSQASGHTSFGDLIAQARQGIAGALTNDDIPLESLAHALNVPHDPSRHPFFQVAITLAPPLASLNPGWDQTFMDADSGGARWDLYLEFSQRSNGLMGRAQYNPDLFRPMTIQRTLNDMKNVLSAVSANTDLPLMKLPVNQAFRQNI